MTRQAGGRCDKNPPDSRTNPPNVTTNPPNVTIIRACWKQSKGFEDQALRPKIGLVEFSLSSKRSKSHGCARGFEAAARRRALVTRSTKGTQCTEGTPWRTIARTLT
jgi:hypothetical protein